MTKLTSRQRMLRAIHLQEPDHAPCAMMSFTALRRRVREDFYALAKAELAMGLDSYLFIPSASRLVRPEHPELRGLPVRLGKEVLTKEWREHKPGDYDILHKEYLTPAGTLSTSVWLTEDWPHGEHIPFIDDFQVSRAIKPLVSEASDLEALSYLLTPPTADDMAAYHAEVERARAFCDEHGILLVGGWGVAMDMADWLCGVDNMIVMSMENQTLSAQLLQMIAEWNYQRMQVVLSAPVDLFIRRAWYEGCDFITPKTFRKLMLPALKREADLVHENGAKFGYICSSGLLPSLDNFMESGVDVLIGLDPVQGTHSDLEKVKEKAGGRMCLWGGVSGAVTVEMGEEAEVRQAVREAIDKLGPEGLILSPVDNLTVDAPRTWENLDFFIDEWQASF